MLDAKKKAELLAALVQLLKNGVLPEGQKAILKADQWYDGDPGKNIFQPIFEFTLLDVEGEKLREIGMLRLHGRDVQAELFGDITEFISRVISVDYGAKGDVHPGVELRGCPKYWDRWIEYCVGVVG